MRNLPARRYDTAEDTLRALHAGEVEAAIVDRISALAYTRECEGLQFVGEPIHDVNYVIPVRSDSFCCWKRSTECPAGDARGRHDGGPAGSLVLSTGYPLQPAPRIPAPAW